MSFPTLGYVVAYTREEAGDAVLYDDNDNDNNNNNNNNNNNSNENNNAINTHINTNKTAQTTCLKRVPHKAR